MRFTIDFDWREFDAGVARFQAGLSRAVVHAVDSAVKDGAAEARLVHQYKDRTGNLTRSIRGYMISNGGPFGAGAAEGVIDAGVDPPAPYAWLVEHGRGTVRPKGKAAGGADVLHWVDPDSGEDVFRMSAGPARPRPFMGPAYLKAERVLQTVLNAEIEALIAKE